MRESIGNRDQREVEGVGSVQRGEDLVLGDDHVARIGVPALHLDYSAPVQLSVIAQTTEAPQIGRVTFNPTTGGLGTLLMANWPADRLLLRMQNATCLNFYAPDQRLVRSVRLAGSVAAVDALNRCRGGAAEPRANTIEPTLARAIDVGWVPEFNADACSIKRMTAKGNELDLFYGRSEGLMLVYRMINGTRPTPGSKLLMQLRLW